MKSKSSGASSKRKRRVVEVVVCPEAFPDFSSVGGSTSRRQSQQQPRRNRFEPSSKDETNGPKLDVQETIREVHSFGAEGFTGQQKKSHAAAEYERITGRAMKRQKIPTKIIRGMREKAKKREAREQRELKESGVVSHGRKKSKSGRGEEATSSGVEGVFGSARRRNTGQRRKMEASKYGPNPDVGFLHKGMLRVNPNKR
ncbi:hypothetical protein THAOC_02301 [Thalassiosira oceanica]|uniref:Uncharacterized protein n=1 Tax=Thalassiosira oceanica TaxID=159749 RepID=K0TEW6_THAOC|nr:hypothetical protein THAOC_02301 [Thalassiosira oceanica]|mmetsp:Transcript_21284/g.49980  ORF Transcript_21284/g.49980 Transcript_21284/m.49980 type:complete len:200 (+) Transcript_21284:105-704(+)|eukprot:EJK75960.1 hypothetical protein THAOC_02301 [Thalassiosira oceanica]